MLRKVTHYSPDFIEMIVSLRNSCKSLSDIHCEYAVPQTTVRGWLKKKSFVAVDNSKEITLEDYQKLKKRTDRIEIENEILKKAISIFTKEQNQK